MRRTTSPSSPSSPRRRPSRSASPPSRTHTSDAAQDEVPVAGPTAGTSAYEYMAELSDELGSRVAGLSTEMHAGDRILEWFGELGYTPDTQDFTFAGGGKTRHSRNIVAVKPGVSGRQIVVGAHYDSVASGRGAFDNASGVALMMQLGRRAARRADALHPRLRRLRRRGGRPQGLGPLRRRDERAEPRRHDPHGQPRLRGHRRPPRTATAARTRPGRSWRCGAWRAASASTSSPAPA